MYCLHGILYVLKTILEVWNQQSLKLNLVMFCINNCELLHCFEETLMCSESAV